MRNLRDYSIVTLAYWVFTLTDGALRMLVLLYLHELGRSPIEIASLFLMYEFFGVVTNFVGGWVGARFGLKSTLFAGLALQVVSFSLLASQAAALTIPIVLVAQALSGIAKDLTKMSSKSYIKMVVPASDQRGLLKWVALLTGSKNTLKGVGFFLGGALLAAYGFGSTCGALAIALAVALVISAVMLPRAVGKVGSKVKFKQLFSPDPRINWLSAARLFLFGSRDIWFVLALPVFLSSALGFSHAQVGGALALWVIGYGIVQALVPAMSRRPVQGARGSSGRLGLSTLALVVPLAGIAASLALGLAPGPVLLVGLALFGVVFAIDSALHSYLIIAYADEDKVALNVGFYYSANAAGRFMGTILSGVLFQAAGQGQSGLLLCIGASIVFVVISAALCAPLRTAERRVATSR